MQRRRGSLDIGEVVLGGPSDGTGGVARSLELCCPHGRGVELLLLLGHLGADLAELVLERGRRRHGLVGLLLRVGELSLDGRKLLLEVRASGDGGIEVGLEEVEVERRRVLSDRVGVGGVGGVDDVLVILDGDTGGEVELEEGDLALVVVDGG